MTKRKKSILIGLVLAVFGIVLAIVSFILIIVLESSLDYDTFNKVFGVLIGLAIASLPTIAAGGIFLILGVLYCKHCGMGKWEKSSITYTGKTRKVTNTRTLSDGTKRSIETTQKEALQHYECSNCKKTKAKAFWTEG